MKYFKLSILLTIIGLGIFFANNVFAATEFVSIIDPDNGVGTDYTSLSSWEQAIQSDLSATTTTLVFSYTTASGTIPDLAIVQGETSGATATSTHMASSSNQILLTNISGIFQAGETIYIQGQATSSNYIISDNNGDSVIVVAKCRSTGGSPDTTAVTIDGWTTSVDNYIKVWTDPDDPYGRHNGKWDDGKYRLEVNANIQGDILIIGEYYTVINGLQAKRTDNLFSKRVIFYGNARYVQISNCIATKVGNTETTYGYSFNGNSDYAKVYNSIAYGCTYGFYINYAGGHYYNNTVVDCTTGFYINGSDNYYLKNCLANNNVTDFTGSGNVYLDNCISSDGTADDFTGANNKASTTVVFIDATNNDFHLSPTDTSAKNAGTNLSSDSNLAITDDIDGTARGGAWDIGADEVPVEYVSTICENTSAGGDCVNMDYSHLGGTGNWEDKVECDLTANTTRVFSGTITGTLNENATVNLCNGSTDLNIDGVVVATTSDQILIDNITGTTTPLVASSGWLWSDEACDSAVNYWTISGTGDDLGASPIAVAMIDGDWSVADTNTVVIQDFTTDMDNYIKVYTTDLARHQGKWDDTKYRLESLSGVVIENRDDNVVFDGLQMKGSGSNPVFDQLYVTDANDTYLKVSKCIFDANNLDGHAVYLPYNASNIDYVYFYNNVVYGGDPTATWGTGVNIQANDGIVYLYNNTVYGFGCNNFLVNSGIVIAKNNIGVNRQGNCGDNNADFDGSFHSDSEYNISSDGTAPGTNSKINQTVSFISTTTGSEDFHLSTTDTSAKDAGTDLSSDTNLNFTTDIDGGTRIGSWDIGADQLSEKIYRSVGNDSSDLNIQSRTVTISGTTATFSDTMPDNIGVGDIIQYGGAGYYQIAVISGRSSSTEYTVQSYDLSSSLSATTTASASVYRAHLTLNDWETQTLENVNSGISDDIDDYVLVGQDLVASNTIMMTACYASDNGDTERVEIDGWITGVDNYIKVYTPVDSSEVGVTQRHLGKWDDEKYKLVAGTGSGNSIAIYESYVRIQGLQIEGQMTSYFGSVVVRSVVSNNNYIEIANNIIRRTIGNIYTGSNYISGINFWSAGSGTIGRVWNNIIYGFTWGINARGSDVVIYNNTISNCYQRGIQADDSGNPILLKNNLVQNTPLCYREDTSRGASFSSSSSNNISSDNTAPGTNSKINTTVSFLDSANHDFHLSPTDTSAIDTGVNLSTSTDLSFSDDIDGNIRRQWDIGADEASVYFDSTIMESGGEFSSLSAWETANQVDLTATTTATFSIASSTGWIPVGSSVTGATSGATASTTVVATSSNKILLYNISGTFISGEDVQLDGATSNAVELSNAGNPAIAVAKIDGAWSIADETAVTIDGWTTGEYNYIKIYTTDSARHNGKWDEGKYRREITNGHGVFINEDNIVLDGLQIYLKGSTGWRYGIAIPGSSVLENLIIQSNIIKDEMLASDRFGLYLSATIKNLNIFNNIIYNFSGSNSYAYTLESSNDGEIKLYSNTFYNNNRSYVSWLDVVAVNNIYQACGDYCLESDDQFYTGTSNNISSDATSPDVAYRNQIVNFIDATNNDFHLSPTDTSAKNAGTNLSSDSNLSFSDDIDGTSRGGAWDIGADEVPVEYVSTICENTSAGGDCANMDYSHLGETGNWEDKVECDLTANTTRVFSGTITGTLNENATVNLCNGSTDLNIDGVVVATTSDQILIDNITGTTTPLVASSGWLWSDEACDSAVNYWTISGTGDDLGASPIAVAMIDGDWGVADTNNIWINDWTTDNDNYIKVYTTDLARHQGRESTGYILQIDNEIRIYEDYVRLDGIEFYNTTNGDMAFLFPAPGDKNNSEIKISNSLFHGFTNVFYMQGYEGTYKFWNNILYDNTGYGFFGCDDSNFYIYNNTIIGGTRGINVYGGNRYFYNNIVQNTTQNNYNTGTPTSSGNNISSDATSPDVAYRNVVVDFISTSTNDFHLAQTDVGAQSQGTDLSSDANLNFTTDIDGGTRIGSWDIGADQLSEKIYRSVGNDSSDLNTNSRTITISGTTATFSDTMPDNIGVGDIIQYGGAGYYQIAVISGRSSNTEYTVQSYDLSSSLSATTTASASVYRAHLTLNDWETQTLENVNSGISDDIDDYVLVGQDLTASNTIMMTACYASDNGDTEAVTIDGWITGVDNYIKVYTPVNSDEVGITQRHNGKWDEGKYRLEINSNDSCIIISESNVTIEGLQIKISSYGAGHRGIGNENETNVTIVDNIITADNGGYNSYGIAISGSSGKYTKIYDNIIYDIYNGVNGIGVHLGCCVAISYVYNNTVYDCVYGIKNEGSGNGSRMTAKNNLSVNNTTADYYAYYATGFPSFSNNISSDGTADDFGGFNNKVNQTVTFVDATNHDFHLSPTDTSAIDAGVNLSTSTDLSFSDDIDGNIRRQWDIGADEASVYFDSTIMESGGEFSSLSAWETANQVDLTATTTATFSIASSTGWIPVGSSITGATSGATASTTVVATSSNKILLYNISGTFISGEDVQLYGATSNAVELSNAGNPAIAVAKIDGAWSIADETAVTIDGWTTGKYNYIKVYTTESARHNGKWDEGKYRLETPDYQTSINLNYGVDYVIIDGIQIKSGGATARAIYTHSGSNYITIKNNIVISNSDYPSITINQTIGTKVYNNILYHNSSNEGVGISFNYANTSVPNVAYNNTIYGFETGINSVNSGDVQLLKNNIVQNCTTGYSGAFDSSSDYNISSDDTAPGTHSKTNTTVQFIDATKNDFHLSLSDTSAKNAGTNLSSDSNLAITDDIDGNTRYDISWDVGADETTTILYRSVGNDTNDLNINSATTTISTTTATFSIDMPAKIGVGDVLQYGFPLQLGFITARISSTTYEIQNRLGALPTATTSASVSIFRAHEFLDDWEDQVVEDVNDGIDESVDDLVLINNMDLTASNTAMFVPCYASTSADNLAVDINSWTTATSNYIKIYTPVNSSEVGETQRHSGVWDDEKYRIETSAVFDYNHSLYIRDNYVKIKGLQIHIINNDYLGCASLYTGSLAVLNLIELSSNILKATETNDESFGYGNADSDVNIMMWNNTIYNFSNGRGIDTMSGIAHASAYYYNNTIYNCGTGIYGRGDTAITKNNVVFNNTDDFAGTFETLDHNASDDLDGTNAIDISPCPVEEDCWKGMFMDYENYDFRIKNANSVLYNSGTTISDVTDDILGIARPQYGIYDVGAFEYSNSTPKYRFKGGKFKLKGKFEFK